MRSLKSLCYLYPNCQNLLERRMQFVASIPKLNTAQCTPITFSYLKNDQIDFRSRARRLSAQSRQSAKLFFQSSEFGPPPPPTRRRMCPSGLHPLVQGRGTLACGRGVGGVPIPTRGHTLWYSVKNLYRSTLWLSVTHWITFCMRNPQNYLQRL
jgi:hypothetical protein